MSVYLWCSGVIVVVVSMKVIVFDGIVWLSGECISLSGILARADHVSGCSSSESGMKLVHFMFVLSRNS